MTNTPDHPSAAPRPASSPSPRLSTVRSKSSAIPRPARRIIVKAALLLAGIAIGALSTRYLPGKKPDAVVAEELGTPAHSGPWGELYTVPFVIAAPEELLPIRALEAAGTHWFFKNTTAAEVANMLESAGLPSEQRAALFAPEIARMKGVDLELVPTPEMVVALPDKARDALYRRLAQSAENRSAFFFIHRDTLSTRFDDSGIAPATLALFHKLCCTHGDYLVLGGLPAILAQLPDREEKVRFMKALTRQKTMLARLRLTKNSDLRALNEYWGKGVRAPNVRAILEGVDRVPGSSFMSIVPLLPPLPASQLYFYPMVPPKPIDGVLQVHDCHWTSLNFFRESSDARVVDPTNFRQHLAANYFRISGDPKYGDVILLSNPANGEVLHSAVFIADDIVFTKNGSTSIYPWMLSTIPDLLKQYSFHAPEGQALTVTYFRNKDA